MAATEGTLDGDTSRMSAVEIQQEYFEAMGGVDWELFEKKDRHDLLQKIAVALCGPPTIEGDLKEEDKQRTLKLQGYDRRNEKITMKVFKKICEQDKYSHNGENILISIIRVVCVAPAQDIPVYKKEPRDYWVNLHSKKGKDVDISIFHVFSIRKCISLQPGVKSCRVYIDHDARVYKDWKSYLKENKLPKSVMVVPKNGVYTGASENVPQSFDDFSMPEVILTILPSPALGFGAKILSIADTTNTVAAIGTLVGAVGLMMAPIAAPLAAGGVLAVATTTSVYGIIRSSVQLADRRKHEQNISLTSSESRASWINILASSAGLSLSASGKLVAWAASTGTNVKILINAVQFLKYTTIASGLLGMVNGFGQMIYKYSKYNEKPTKLELFQFTSSLLFFGIGVMSNQTAQEIVEEAQANSINKVRDTLTSNAKREVFDKITAETRRLKGSIPGNAEVIKALKTITNKNEFFAKLSKMNEQLNNANKLRISLSSDGTAHIIAQHKMTLLKLSELGKADRDTVFASFGPAKVITKNVPRRTTSWIVSNIKDYTINIRPEQLFKIAIFVKQLCESDKNVLFELLSKISSNLHNAFKLLCAELLSTLVPVEMDSILGSDWKSKVICGVFDFFISRLENNIDDEINSSFQHILKQFIVDGKIKVESLEMLRDKIMNAITTKTSNPGSSSDPRIYDGLFKLRNKSPKKYETIEAGKVYEVGEHKVLLKTGTVDKLQTYLEPYSQEECDLLVEFCFKVASMLSAEEVAMLKLINLDEDVIMRIFGFMIRKNFVKKVLIKLKKSDCLDMKTVLQIRKAVIASALAENKRNHLSCKICQGIQYCD